MNCKPGDLAVIVNGGYFDRHLIGKIVRVLAISQKEPNICWSYDGPRLSTVWGAVIGLADEMLRPIRDPGDDATDETLTWLPVPSRGRETV